MIVAIQGLVGSFHNEAADNLLPHESFELLECQSFHDVFAAVANEEVEYGVVAIENSLHGSINAVYRLLERYNLWISGETTLHIKQYLIGHSKVALETLNRPEVKVLSQAPALAQCELWLDEHLPLAVRQETHDTAASVQMVVEKHNGSVAIAGKRAAKLYGGHVIAGPINDDPHNYTRFFLLQKEPCVSSDATRTSIILQTDHKPGSLYSAIGAFEHANINLSKLDSHPIPTDKRHYSFYVDFDANVTSEAAQNALAELKSQGCIVKILGSYKVA